MARVARTKRNALNGQLSLFLIAVLLITLSPDFAVSAIKMRPYSGIGLLAVDLFGSAPHEQLAFYDEPAMLRLEDIDLSKAPRHEWIFPMGEGVVPLIVMERKGAWLKVVYDDAGRESWVKQPQHNACVTWDEVFIGRMAHLLPGLQKRYYQLYAQFNGEQTGSLEPDHIFKVILLEDDWAQVESVRNGPAWLRWRDEDGRLLMGLE